MVSIVAENEVSLENQAMGLTTAQHPVIKELLRRLPPKNQIVAKSLLSFPPNPNKSKKTKSETRYS